MSKVVWQKAASPFGTPGGYEWICPIPSNTLFVGPTQVSPKIASRLVQPFLQESRTWQTNTQTHTHTHTHTDRATPSVVVGRILRTECMRCGLLIILYAGCCYLMRAKRNKRLSTRRNYNDDANRIRRNLGDWINGTSCHAMRCQHLSLLYTGTSDFILRDIRFSISSTDVCQ